MVAAAGVGENDPNFIGPPRPTSTSSGGKTEEQTAVSNAIDEYNHKAKELENRYKNGILTSQQYQKELANEKYKVLQDIGVYKDLEKIIDSLGGDYRKFYNEIKSGAKQGGGGGGATTNPLLEAFKKFSEEKKKIDNQFKNGFIDEGTHNEKTLSLIEDLEEVVGAQDDVEASVKGLGGTYWELWKAVEAGKPGLKALKEQFDQQKKAAEDAADSAKKDAEKAKEGQEKLAEALKEQPGEFKNNRDTTFDYKKSQNEIDKGNLDIIKDYVKEWQDYIKVLEKIQAEYGDLEGAVSAALDKAKKSLADAMAASNSAQATATVSEIIEDMTELKKEVMEGYWDRFTTIVDGFQNVASAIESCRDAFERLDEKDADFFDGLKAGFSVIETMVTMLETVNNTVKMFQTTNEAFHKLQELNKKKEIASNAAVAASAQAAAIAKTEGAAKSVAAGAAEAAAANGVASAEATAAAAKGASSVANTPYIGPILAVAAIASIVGALMAAFAKFEKGGIVGGNSTTGDRNFIRANSGEAVLTKHMQGNLLRILRDGGTGGQVEFKIKGSDLIGVQKNYDRRLRG